MVVFLVYITIL